MEEKINEDKIVFLDWDDTLFPSSELISHNIDPYSCNINHIPTKTNKSDEQLIFQFDDELFYLQQEHKKSLLEQFYEELKQCETQVIKLLEMFISNDYCVYIITNASNGWVEKCIANMYQELYDNLVTDNIIIISARSNYEKYVGNINELECKNFSTKYLCIKNQLEFSYELEHTTQYNHIINSDDHNKKHITLEGLDLYDFLSLNLEKIYKKFIQDEKIDNKKIKQIISIGDQKSDILVANKISKWNTSSPTITVKFFDKPHCDDIIKQLQCLTDNFDHIFLSDKCKTIDMKYMTL